MTALPAALTEAAGQPDLDGMPLAEQVAFVACGDVHGSALRSYRCACLVCRSRGHTQAGRFRWHTPTVLSRSITTLTTTLPDGG